MPRVARHTPGGYAYHVLNRGVGRMRLFTSQTDYVAFETILAETIRSFKLRICAYCIMPNHWHFVVWAEGDGEFGQFFQRLTVTHAARFQRHRQRIGMGHVYQDRFKSFPVQDDDHFYHVVRYVERNPVRAHLVRRRCDWRWSSHCVRERGGTNHRALLSDWAGTDSARLVFTG